MIYLDNAATTRPSEVALAHAKTYLTEEYFNPSALYSGGFRVSGMLKEARKNLVSMVADPSKFELAFASGGTEGDNQAIFSCAKRGNAVTSSGEHAAVYECFVELKNRGVEPRFAPLHRDGSVDVEALLALVDDRTSLVSVVHVNNETGAINDIFAIAKAVKKKNPRCIFHSDGVQAFGKLAFRLTSEIDLYTVSAHKIGGVKGTGALIMKKGLPLRPLIFGGGQEGNKRSGTENVFGIAVFSHAARETFLAMNETHTRLIECREALWGGLDKGLFSRISPENGTPYILTVSAAGMRGEVLQRLLWERGVVVGTGSACASRHRFSRVLTACGYEERILDGVLRMSFSHETTQEEITLAAEALNAVAREFSNKV